MTIKWQDGERIEDDSVERDDQPQDGRRAQWTQPCPENRPQRVAHCLGYREREPGRLQLRVALCEVDHGVCAVIVDEHDDAVRVRLLVCYDEERWKPLREREYVNCPVHVYLDKPLAERMVVDVQTDESVPLFVPNW